MKMTEILYKANGSLARLTKVRCSIDISTLDIGYYKHCALISWPFFFEKSNKLIFELQKYNIYKNKERQSKGYQIQYDEYKNLKNTENIDILNIRYLRSAIVIFNLINSPKVDITVGLTWDKENNIYDSVPESTNDFKLIHELSDKRDIQYTFVDNSGNWKFKAPAFLGPIIFEDLSLFKNKNIINNDIRTFRGRKTDFDGRSYRIIIDHSQRENLESVVSITSSNISKLLPKDKWNEKVKNAVWNYYKGNG